MALVEPHQHVRHILVAEFDIDRGSSLTHQYPSETGADENFLAEQMLPDGAHLREEDWTVFFLNRRRLPNTEVDGIDDSTGDKHGGEARTPLFVLNLVRTKHDLQARRGAMVKAMAICVTFPAVDIFKAILLLAMERYFQAPSVEVLAALFRTVNSLDLDAMPTFSPFEKRILRCWDIPDLFEERFAAAAAERRVGNDATTNQVDAQSTMAGARKDRHFYETTIVYDGISIPIRMSLTSYAEEVSDFSLIKLISTFSSTTSSSTQTSTLSSASPLSSNTANFPLPHHPHLTTSGAATHPIIVLINALLTEKRILFLGHECPAGDVANHVLAACALGSGGGDVLRGFTERAFPYANLAHLDDLLSCPGYIAGVTNPAFKDHPEWWDVLCDIKTKRVTISSKIAAPETIEVLPRDAEKISSSQDDVTSGLTSHKSTMRDTFDAEFIHEVLMAIQSHYSEIAIRAKFRDYILRFVRLAAAYEANVLGSSEIDFSARNTSDPTGLLGYGMYFSDEGEKQRSLRINRQRIEGWRRTQTYQYYIQDFSRFLQSRSVSLFDVQRQISKLQSPDQLSLEELEAMLEAMLRSTENDTQIIEFLSYFAQNHGGLQPLAACLFHRSVMIREGTVLLLQQICANPNGYRFVQCLNRFYRLAFDRMQSQA